MKEWAEQDIEIDLSLIGAKAMAFFNSYGGNVVAALRDIGEEPSLESLIGGVKTMLDAYERRPIDRLFLVSNEFVNTMTQTPRWNSCCRCRRKTDGEMQHHWDYIYEPEARDLLEAC
jgi:F-type H+-transporting ATPase subunit gamma